MVFFHVESGLGSTTPNGSGAEMLEVITLLDGCCDKQQTSFVPRSKPYYDIVHLSNGQYKVFRCVQCGQLAPTEGEMLLQVLSGYPKLVNHM